jgi:hypothetical protein
VRRVEGLRMFGSLLGERLDRFFDVGVVSEV